ncbi:MAG: hypothetical protein SFW36_11410 [Leptolyngbyaceae cyanobacterium bins.59]|nr:hypothetical protein [Leptolyngbyaceae cyanobacterium bins.59]
MIESEQLKLLENLKDILEDLSFKSTLLKQSDQLPFDTLLTEFSPDEHNRSRCISHTFFPIEEDSATHLLQFFFQLPFQLKSNFLIDLKTLLLVINNKVPIGGYSIDENDRTIHFRYVMVLPRYVPLNTEVITDTITFYVYSQDIFCPVIESLNDGQLSLKQALKTVNSASE